MKKINFIFKRVACTIITLALVFTSMNFANVDAATASTTYVYYISDGDLYRVMSNGTNEQLILSDFSGDDLTSVGNYLYYTSDKEEFMRIAVDGSEEEPSCFTDDEILYYDTDGTYIYYLNSYGEIYRSLANAESGEEKLVIDQVDTSRPKFFIVNGQIYYNALKNGKTTWAASKAVNGSGNVRWIAAGAFLGTFYLSIDSVNINTT